MSGNVKDRIEAANDKVIGMITKAQPTWVDVAAARDFIPDMKDNMVLHAGPPLDPDRAAKPLRTAICGAVVHEGLAADLETAWAMVKSGEIELAPALDHRNAAGAAFCVTASTQVLIAEDRESGARACCAIQEGPSNDALRWGLYNETVENRLQWFDTVLGPVLAEAIRAKGGLNLRNVVARGEGMGDENHSRQLASNALAVLEFLPALMDVDTDNATRKEIITFLSGAERFFLHLFIAGAAAVMEAVKGTEYSTVLVAMGGNSVEFGTKFAGTGDEWFTAPAPKCLGMLLNPTWTEDVVVPYLGDSCAVEVYGFGGLSAAAGPMVVRLAGGDFQEAVRRTEEAREVCIGTQDWAPIPWLDFRGPPVGVDMRRVIAASLTPTSHGGTAHVNGGQAGAGSCNLPLECFRKGLKGFAAKYSV